MLHAFVEKVWGKLKVLFGSAYKGKHLPSGNQATLNNKLVRLGGNIAGYFVRLMCRSVMVMSKMCYVYSVLSPPALDWRHVGPDFMVLTHYVVPDSFLCSAD